METGSIFSESIKQEMPPRILILGWSIDFVDEFSSPPVLINEREGRVVVNLKKFKSIASAQNTGIFSVAKEVALQESLQISGAKQILETFSKDPVFVNYILHLTGARILNEREEVLSQKIVENRSFASSFVAEFKDACCVYLATGEFPQTSIPVAEEIRKLPASTKGEHLLVSLTKGSVALSRKEDYFTRFIAPAIARLKEIDLDSKLATGENFKPSTDDNEEGQELNESEIMQFVEPFLGGYFREKVMDGVDWDNMKVVATGVQKERLLTSEIPRSITNNPQVFNFKAKNGLLLQNEAITAPLPASALVWPETLTDGLSIYQSINGTHTIEWQAKDDQKPPENYEFKFEKSNDLRWQKTEPTEEEQGIPEEIISSFSEEAQSFLGGLKSAHITDEAKVRQIARKVQKGIEYVNDSKIGMALGIAGQEYFSKLEELKKGDCDVCNFYALAQIRALGIPCRMITGFHISKDKRFPFAPLAGTKHAWLEWWNKDEKIWQRIDATPPKKEEEKEDEDEEKAGGGGGLETKISEKENPEIEPDETDDDPWQIVEEEDLERLKNKLGEISETVIPQKNRNSQIFKEVYGIDEERWMQIRNLVEKIGREKIPASVSIDGLASDISSEWQKIYKCLLVAYSLPDRKKVVIGKESMGGVLVDPVSAGIDIMLGSDDPYGFREMRQKETQIHLPIHFSNDFLMDTTASMRATNNRGESLLELERNFIISSLYEGFKINEMLKQRSAELHLSPLIINHILSIHGGGEWSEVLKTKAVSMADLVRIDDLLKQSRPGGGAMADCLESYAQTLENDSATVKALKNGDMVKTLTIITDGNLWCSACGKESCDIELHGPSLVRVKKALERIAKFGVFINTIGFSETSRPVAELFEVPGDPESAIVVENLADALKAHHAQTLRAMKPVFLVSGKTREFTKK